MNSIHRQVEALNRSAIQLLPKHVACLAGKRNSNRRVRPAPTQRPTATHIFDDDAAFEKVIFRTDTTPAAPVERSSSEPLFRFDAAHHVVRPRKQLLDAVQKTHEQWARLTKLILKSMGEKIDERARQKLKAGDYRSITEMVEYILDTFPTASPATLVFGSPETCPHSALVTAQVVAELARLELGPVLLVDARFGPATDDSLTATTPTRAIKMDIENRGFVDLINHKIPWQPLVQQVAETEIGILPAGGRRGGPAPLDRDKLVGARLGSLFSQLKRHFQFICLVADEIDDPAVSRLATFCDGVVPIVELDRASVPLTQASINDLRRAGIRISGCIAVKAA